MVCLVLFYSVKISGPNNLRQKKIILSNVKILVLSRSHRKKRNKATKFWNNNLSKKKQNEILFYSSCVKFLTYKQIKVATTAATPSSAFPRRSLFFFYINSSTSSHVVTQNVPKVRNLPAFNANTHSLRLVDIPRY